MVTILKIGLQFKAEVCILIMNTNIFNVIYAVVINIFGVSSYLYLSLEILRDTLFVN